jgi:DNA-binding PadR family transcriptional regulator
VPRPLGITSLQILAASRAARAYGLDIVARTGLAAGTVYPTLSRLRDAGLLRAQWEDQRQADREGRPRRRFYVLTAAGVAALAAGATRLQSAAATVRAALATRRA